MNTDSLQIPTHDLTNTDILDINSTSEMNDLDSNFAQSEYVFENENTYSKFDNDYNRSKTELSTFKDTIKNPSRKAIKALQKWKGTVIEISESCFEARLEDLTHGGNDELETFFFSDITKNEREELKIGKTFYWTIGQTEYIDLNKIERTSRIVFQRTLDWNIALIDTVRLGVEKYWLFDEE